LNMLGKRNLLAHTYDEALALESYRLIKQGMSKIRNQVIARTFREFELIEQWGTGVRRIFHEAEQLGLPEPEIVEIGMRIRLTIFLAVYRHNL